MQRMKARNRLFSKKEKTTKISTPISDKKIILNHKSIYSIIGSFIIAFRLINWRAPLDEQHLVRGFCIEAYTSKISEALDLLKITALQKSSVLILCRKIMNKITIDNEKNSSWGTALLVEQYRKMSCKEFATLYDPFEEMIYLRERFARIFLSFDNKHFPSKHKITQARLNQLIGISIYMQQVGRFFEDMPGQAFTKHNIIFYLLSATMFATSPIFIAAGKYFDISYLQLTQLSWDIDSLIPILAITGASYGMHFLYQVMKELIFTDFTQNPFTFDNMTTECQAALFKEIADCLYPSEAQDQDLKRHSFPTTSSSDRYTHPSSSLKTPETTSSNDEKKAQENPLKKVKQKTRPYPHLNNQTIFSSLPSFAHSNLPPPLNIVWETKSYGTISYWFGHPETYRLWSILPQLKEFCEKSFAHFPTKKLKKENNEDTIDHYKNTAEIGRLVSDTDRSGFVRTSSKALKLKTFSKFYKNSRMPFLLFEGKPVQAPPEFINAQVYVAQNPITDAHGSSEESQALYKK